MKHMLISDYNEYSEVADQKTFLVIADTSWSLPVLTFHQSSQYLARPNDMMLTRTIYGMGVRGS